MNQIQEILSTLRELGSEERAEKSSVMYPTSMRVLGVPNPSIKLVVKELHALMKKEPRDQFLSLAYDLMEIDILECQMLVWMLLDKAKIVPSLTVVEAKKLEGLLDNWVSVDTYGTLIYGVLWRLKTIPDSEVYALQEFENVWYRRLALVGTVGLNLRSRGGTGDTLRTLTVCRRAVDDKHDMIVKAVSWSLRSLIIWDSQAVAAFIEEYRERLSKRVIREVTHKLDFGTKN